MNQALTLLSHGPLVLAQSLGRAFLSFDSQLDFAEDLLSLAPGLRRAQAQGDIPQLRNLLSVLSNSLFQTTYKTHEERNDDPICPLSQPPCSEPFRG